MNKYIAELYGTFLLVLAIIGTFLMCQSMDAPGYLTLHNSFSRGIGSTI